MHPKLLSWREKGTYLALTSLSERMPFQIMLKMGIIYAIINLSSVCLGPGLTRRKSWLKTTVALEHLDPVRPCHRSPRPPSSLVRGNCEEPPPEPVRDWNEVLAFSTEHQLLVWCAMCMPLARAISSWPLSKRRWRVRATCTLVETVSSSLLDKFTQDGTIARAFPRSSLDLGYWNMFYKSKFRLD